MTDKLPKPQKGSCGTCSWFEPMPLHMQPKPPIGMKAPIVGVCCFSPPSPFPMMAHVPGSSLSPTGPQQAPQAMGLRPPVNELLRCSQWRPMGTDPPFFDAIRPGVKDPGRFDNDTLQQ